MNETTQPAVAGPVEPTVRPQDGDVAETLTKALRRAYHLGQTYWQQADSESYAQNRRADETARKFEALLGETTGALAAAVAAERERCAQLCEQWNATPGSRLAREIRGEKPATHVKTAAEMRYDAAHDTSCVGAFARARPGKA